MNCELNKTGLDLKTRISLSLCAPVALTLVVCYARAQASNPSEEEYKGVTIARCAKITASDPRFGPLAQVCQYALSPNNLPSFVCEEAAQQFAKSSGPEEWQNLAVVTAVVIFEKGKGDRISKVAKDGRPIRALSKPNQDSDVFAYFLKNLKWRAPVLNVFGSHLLWVFAPHGKAQFEYRGEMNVDDRTMIVYGYRVRKFHGPIFGWNWPGQNGTYVAMDGLLWVDKASSSLRRMVAHFTDFDPGFDVFAASSAMDYSWLEISDLGKFLLPTGAEHIQCDRGFGCWKDVVKFSNCHKYAGKSRIVPAQ